MPEDPTRLSPEDEELEIAEWIDAFFSQERRCNLICVLLAVQERFGYLSPASMREVARKLDLSPARVYGVATFYNKFRFVPPGKHAIRVCMGTACHIKQATKILEHWERRLEIEVGGVTPDREYSLDRVDCVGCCSLAPVALIGDEVLGAVSPTKIDGILLQHRMAREAASKEEEP